ncbi:GNAT family N-acetyltransferase [Actinacidiphila acidipaludis]|uniref:GNAT family N-acetyltransferase n=1 Tax=Actinacidiphila acidipaludis TaxID=2873382 RepID=A0ABS7QDU1_9ACTN|nr:GNAT family N-acetyltransferase [Streptomyces acidipaludis]MBY8880849.1 GNAT family N-acetyltransferase [Streptomyces acidipaludis]
MFDADAVLSGEIRIRPVEETDAGPLAEAYVRNRDHLRPWEPNRAEVFFTPEGQKARIGQQLRLREDGQALPWVLTEGDRIVGTATLSTISGGPFRSAYLGYWIDRELGGRGLATLAARYACRVADEELGLHRLEAGTLLDNAGSQRVLAKAGFERIGVAPRYLHINGAWRDHVLFQRILNDRPAL